MRRLFVFLVITTFLMTGSVSFGMMDEEKKTVSEKVMETEEESMDNAENQMREQHEQMEDSLDQEKAPTGKEWGGQTGEEEQEEYKPEDFQEQNQK